MAQEVVHALLYTTVIWLSAIAVTLLLDRIRPFKRRTVSFSSPRREAALALCLVVFTLALFLLLRIALAPLLQTLREEQTYGPLRMVVQLCFMGIALVPFATALLIRHQTLSTIGLSYHNLGPSVLLGVVLGGVTIATYVIVFGKVFTGFREVSFSHLYFLVASLSVGFTEEIIFRGYLQLRLTAWLGARRGLILMAIVFTAGHFGQSLLGLASVFVTGLVFGWVMRKGENIVGLSIWHAIMDWVWIL